MSIQKTNHKIIALILFYSLAFAGLNVLTADAQEIIFFRNLRYGDSGSDVKILQECLKTDPSIYPEGSVTAHFGPLTQAAVIRFQEKYADEILRPLGLFESTGFVGNSTRTKLNSFCAGLQIPSESLPTITLSSPALISPADGSDFNSSMPVLEWSEVSGAEAYEWKIVGDANGKSRNPEVKILSSRKLEYGHTYLWKARACEDLNLKNCSAWSDAWEFSTRPELEGPKKVTFKWTYGGQDYSLTKKLYESVYEYYKERVEDDLNQDTIVEDYYLGFLEISDKDKTISQIASGVESRGRSAGLNDDQIAELAIAFVQAIPYNEAKAEKINLFYRSQKDSELDLNIPPSLIYEVMPGFPYETLFDNTGICSDKSILTVALLQELGYGAAFFDYDEEHHTAAGIRCPKEHSSYESGYCFIETTAPGLLIGDIDPEYSEPEVYKLASGKTYKRIVETEQLLVEKEALGEEMNELENEINDLDQRLQSIEDQMNHYKSIGAWNGYNALVPEWNDLASAHNQKIAEYSNKAELFAEILDKIGL